MPHVSAPGKMFLAGEWAILESGNSGLVGAVNKRVHAQVEERPSEGPQPVVSITIDDFSIKDRRAQFDGKHLLFSPELSEAEQPQFKFIKEAIETVLQYIQPQMSVKPFAIRTWGELSQIEVDGQTKKVGFGSSASTVVATIAGIMELHGLHLEKHKEQIFKLAAAAHYFAQGKLGSCFDIAASTYGGVFSYVAPDLKAVAEQMAVKPVKAVVESRWPLLQIQPLDVPDDFNLAVGWTKTSVSTPDMIKAMNIWKEQNKGAYSAAIERIAEVVDLMIQAWKLKDRERILNLVKQNRAALAELTKLSGVPIETDDLRKLAEIADQNGAAGKLSGAGGGDCGIAFCFGERVAEAVKAAWQSAGLWPLDVALDRQGVRVEKQ
ncbi:MAG: phosphomevalonate kinase [Candidatus Aenigmatarchaeota archaeon]